MQCQGGNVARNNKVPLHRLARKMKGHKTPSKNYKLPQEIKWTVKPPNAGRREVSSPGQ